MLKKYLKDTFKILTGAGTLATLHGFYNNNNNQELKLKLDKAMAEYKELVQKCENLQTENKEEKCNNLKFDELNTEVLIAKLETLKVKLELDRSNTANELSKLDKLDNLDPNNALLTDMQNKLEKIVNDSVENQETVNKMIEIYLNNKNKFWEDGIATIKELYEEWNLMLNTLTYEQLGALAHIMSATFILLCLITIMGIVYSDFLLVYLKIEEKFPRIGKIIKLRRKFQQFYLFINFMLILLILFAVIFVDYSKLF